MPGCLQWLTHVHIEWQSFPITRNTRLQTSTSSYSLDECARNSHVGCASNVRSAIAVTRAGWRPREPSGLWIVRPESRVSQALRQISLVATLGDAR